MSAGSVLRATVVSAYDPQGLGRVKLQVPQATGAAAIWAAPLQTGGGLVPAPGSAVWVLHESGDPGLPVYIPAAVWGPWTPVPSSWVSAGWEAGTAAYRLGPGGQVAFRGQLVTPVATSSTTLLNGLLLLSVPGALVSGVGPVACPVAMTLGSPSAASAAVAMVEYFSVFLYGGPWTYGSGAAAVYLDSLCYST